MLHWSWSPSNLFPLSVVNKLKTPCTEVASSPSLMLGVLVIIERGINKFTSIHNLLAAALPPICRQPIETANGCSCSSH
jgi:hypothetical protein